MTGAFGVVYLVGLIVGAVPAVGFPVLYTLRSVSKPASAWWRSEMGRHLFAYSVLFALLYCNGLVHLVFSVPAAVQVWINLFLVVFAAVVSWQRIGVYLHAQRRARQSAPVVPGEAEASDT